MKLVFKSKWGNIPITIYNSDYIHVVNYCETAITHGQYQYFISLTLVKGEDGTFNYDKQAHSNTIEKTYQCVGKFGVPAPSKFKENLLTAVRDFVNANVTPTLLNKAELKQKWNLYKETRGEIKEKLREIYDLQKQRIEELSAIKKLRQTM